MAKQPEQDVESGHPRKPKKHTKAVRTQIKATNTHILAIRIGTAATRPRVNIVGNVSNLDCCSESCIDGGGRSFCKSTSLFESSQSFTSDPISTTSPDLDAQPDSAPETPDFSKEDEFKARTGAKDGDLWWWTQNGSPSPCVIEEGTLSCAGEWE